MVPLPHVFDRCTKNKIEGPRLNGKFIKKRQRTSNVSKSSIISFLKMLPLPAFSVSDIENPGSMNTGAEHVLNQIHCKKQYKVNGASSFFHSMSRKCCPCQYKNHFLINRKNPQICKIVAMATFILYCNLHHILRVSRKRHTYCVSLPL